MKKGAHATAPLSYLPTNFTMPKRPKFDRLEDLAALAKVLRDVNPDLLEEITVAERQRIASLIELREGPGRFL